MTFSTSSCRSRKFVLVSVCLFFIFSPPKLSLWPSQFFHQEEKAWERFDTPKPRGRKTRFKVKFLGLPNMLGIAFQTTQFCVAFYDKFSQIGEFQGEAEEEHSVQKWVFGGQLVCSSYPPVVFRNNNTWENMVFILSILKELDSIFVHSNVYPTLAFSTTTDLSWVWGLENRLEIYPKPCKWQNLHDTKVVGLFADRWREGLQMWLQQRQEKQQIRMSTLIHFRFWVLLRFCKWRRSKGDALMMKEIMMRLRKDQGLPVAGFAWNLNP